MTTLRALLLISCCALSGACVIDTVEGSGNVVTEPRTVPGFSGVSVSGSGQLFLEQGSADSLTVTVDDNLLPYIRTDVRGNTLMLGTTDASNVRPTRGIVFRMTVKSVDALGVSGSGTIDARALDQSRLTLGISGSGAIHAQGTADAAQVSISGSGKYTGEGMTIGQATVDISGSGAAVMAVRDTLAAHISGSGSVEYIGNPKVSEQLSGSGSVRRR